MDCLRTLFDRQPVSSPPALPDGLSQLYDGDLQFPQIADRPYIVANFATTLDGVVSFKIPGQSGGNEITGSNPLDHQIMGLLRACADAVIVGAGTFRDAGSEHLWTPDYIFPPATQLFQTFRRGRPRYPLTVIATSSGNINMTSATFRTPGLRSFIITGIKGRKRIDAVCSSAECSADVYAHRNVTRTAPEHIVELLRRTFRSGLILLEGGPTLFAQFLRRGLIDELFLTIAPQIAGRDSKNARPALIRNLAFTPQTAPWLQLLSIKRGGDHLYLRYGRPSVSQ